MHHYARGVAHASLKQIAAAERERALFHDSLARIPPGRRFLSNPALTTLAVGAAMLDGELDYHKGNFGPAFAHLRESAAPSTRTTSGRCTAWSSAWSGAARRRNCLSCGPGWRMPCR